MVTGATGHLGKIISETLAELGAKLVLVDRPDSDFDRLTASLAKLCSVNIEPLGCDLEQQDQRTELIAWMKSSGQFLNILVNKAALAGASRLPGWSVPFEEQTVATWRRALEFNLTAKFDHCQGLTPLLRDVDGVNIINIASTYGIHGPDMRLYEGNRKGFDCELMRAVSAAVSIPVIASGGMGTVQHLVGVVQQGQADAVAMADILHYERATMAQVRAAAIAAQLDVRKFA